MLELDSNEDEILTNYNYSKSKMKRNIRAFIDNSSFGKFQLVGFHVNKWLKYWHSWMRLTMELRIA